MNNNQANANKRPRFILRAFTSVLLAAAFIVLVITGVFLFVSPPGRIANWTNWNLLGLTKKEWIDLHVCFSALFLLGSILHLILNLRPLFGYFKDNVRRSIGFRLEWAFAIIICALVFAGTRWGTEPFSSFLAFNEKVKQSWDKPRARAPIPHAELLTLSELAEKAGVEMAVASNRLAAKGITGLSPDIIVQKLADQNQRSAQQIYETLLSEPSHGRSEGGRGGGGGYGRGGSGGGGGGVGWKTLAQFCTDEGMKLEEAQARLRAKGIKADAQQTLREIAVSNGYSRPSELLEILRKK